MSSEYSKSEYVSEAAVDEIGKMLRDLRSPDELVSSASAWLDSALYAAYRKKDPQALPYQILKALLSDVLQEMDAENHDLADLLRARFWKGQTIKEIVLDSSWSERTIFSQQNKAIKLFAYMLLQREQVSSVREAAGNPAGPGFFSLFHEGAARRNRYLLFGIVLLALVFGSFWLLARNNSVRNEPLASTSIAQPTTDAVMAVMKNTAVPTSLATETSIPVIEIQPSATASPILPSLCGETTRLNAPTFSRLVRSQGVSAFTVINTEGAIFSNRIRALEITPTGLWIGYYSIDGSAGGVGHYDKQSWAACGDPGSLGRKNINAMVSDEKGSVWVGYEEDGVAHFDGSKWSYYTIENGLPSNAIYGLYLDNAGILWVSTWEGIARFDGQNWTVPYTVKNDTIYNDRVHAITFDSDNNIWVGHISSGVSLYQHSIGEWVYLTEEKTGLGGNEIRDMLVQPASETEPEAVWIATSDGGISRFKQGEWTVYQVDDGLPSNDVKALALDRYNRVWAATQQGVVYQDNEIWTIYHTLESLSIAIGPSCSDQSCPFDDDVVWTGTTHSGLTHSRLPLPEPVLDIRSVCFVDEARERICPELSPLEFTSTPVITATYPVVLTPGETVRFEVTAVTRPPYQLRENRGDFLSNADGDDFNLFGAWPIIPVKDVAEPGQPFTFTDYDNPFTAPELSEDILAETYVSTWRVWMHTRYAGPYIRLVFTVAQE